jgi:hypothetical protein
VSNSNSSGGLSFGSVLLLIFVVLKLTGHIDWSWVWVLSPIWILLGLVLLIVAMWGLFAGVAGLLREYRHRKRLKEMMK